MKELAERSWDKFHDELVDTIRSQHNRQPNRPCKYCGHPTRSVYQVCLAHNDLVDLDPAYPSPAE